MIGDILFYFTFMTSPLIFSFPDINNRCACVFPLTSFPKSSSDMVNVTIFAVSAIERHVVPTLARMQVRPLLIGILRTVGFGRLPFSHLPLFLQIDIPAFCLTALILECESENSVPFLYCVFALSSI